MGFSRVPRPLPDNEKCSDFEVMMLLNKLFESVDYQIMPECLKNGCPEFQAGCLIN